MPVPSSLNDLSTTPSLNSPAGSESPALIDDYLRTQAAFIKQVSDASVTKTSGTGSAALPTGTTAQRDSTPVTGAIRFNSTTSRFEGFNGSVWTNVATDGSDALVVDNVQLGDSLTATNNFVLKTNADGTAKLARGNVGATTQDILTVDADGKVTSTQVYTPAGAGAVATTVQSKLRESVTPADFGAVGDGVTDDTQALRNWLNADAGIHLLGSNDKTYIVNAPNTGDVILPLPSGKKRSIYGHGATIKVANGARQFEALLGSNSFGVDLSDLTVEGVIFDHNKANNTFPVTSGNLTYPHYTIAVRKGSRLNITNNTIKNAVCTNCLFLNGNDGTGVINVTHVFIEHNRFLNLGGSANVQDHSTMYLHCDDFTVHDNYGEGASLGATGTACFIETHGTRQTVTDNAAKNFDGFANICGIYEGGDTEQSLVTGNHGIAMLEHGIRLFSVAYGQHTTGYGIIGLMVSNNRMRIRQTQLTAGTSKFYIGVGFQAGATLPVKDVQIIDNVVEYDLESTTPAYTAFSYAIGSNETTGQQVFENFVISGNTVVNAPGPAIGLGNGGGIFKNAHIGPNTLINPGQGLSSAILSNYKAGVAVDGYSCTGSLTIDKQTIIDNHAVTRLNFGVVSFISTDCSAIPCTVDLDIKITGDKAAFVSAMDNYISYLLPLMTCRQNLPHTRRFNNFKIRSSVLDTVNDVEYRVLTTGYVWTKHYYGTAAPTSGFHDQGSTVTNTSPTAAGNFGWVCTTAGTPGTWKTFGAIAA